MEQPGLNYTDHDLLIRIHTLLEVARGELSSFKDSTTKEIADLWSQKGSKTDIQDHETRLRAIERRVLLFAGGLAVIEIGLAIYFRH